MDYDFAIRIFNDAKELFEIINKTQDEMYPVVISNIKYAEDKQMEQMTKELANSLQNDESNDDNEYREEIKVCLTHLMTVLPAV